MEDYYYYKCPTGIYIVKDGLNKAGEIIKKEGYKKIFIIYGGQHLVKSGQLALLEASLQEQGISFKEKGGVLPNPDISFVKEALPIVREYQPDLILAIGGGSVIDTAKNLKSAYFYPGDPLDFNKKIAKPSKSLPLGVILTLAAAGSEMSDSCVMSERTTNFKSGFNDINNRPTFSIEDPSLTLSVGPYQTFCGLVDIISHSFERYFSPSSKYELCDYLALSVIKECVELAPALIKDPSDLEARRGMMIASTVSHNGWTSFGKSMRFKCHFVEHQMSGKHPELTHGLGLRFLLGKFMEVNKEELKDKINQFGKFVFNVSSDNPDDSIKAFNDFLDSLPLVKTMQDVNIDKKEEETYISQLKI